MNDIIETFANVTKRINAAAKRSGRNPDKIQLIAVTKTHGEDVVRDALDAGLSVFGENKVQEAAWKIPLSPSNARWQLIGHLQSNKARQAVRLFSVIHSIDSVKLLETVEKAAAEAGERPEIYLEVNVSNEPSKYGVAIDKLDELARRAANLNSVTLSGLMTMAPFFPDVEKTRPVFAKLRECRDSLEQRFGLVLPHLSMGMSRDFEIAIEEGSTDIRVGTDLFGQRPKVKLGAHPLPEIVYD